MLDNFGGSSISGGLRVSEDPMLPPKKSKPANRRLGVYLSDDTLLRAQAIADQEHAKSRNQILDAFLSFAVELFPLLKPLRENVESFAERETAKQGREVSYAAAIAILVERGLRATKAK